MGFAWLTKKHAAVAAVVVVVGAVSTGSSVELTSYSTTISPQTCVVVNGKIKPGTYTGTIPITRHVDRDRPITVNIVAHDHIDESATLDVTVIAEADGGIYGTWNYHSSVSGSITTNGSNTNNMTPYEVSIQGGALAGSGLEVAMSGGTGSISPQANVDNGYVSFSTNPALNHVIDNPLTVDPSVCDRLTMTVRYPFTGLTMVDFVAPTTTPAIILARHPSSGLVRGLRHRALKTPKSK